MAEQSKEQENAQEFAIMMSQLTRSRTLKRKQTEVYKQVHKEELWTPNELTPVNEEVLFNADFQPSSFRVYDAGEAGQLETFGTTEDGQIIGTLNSDEGPFCYVEYLSMKLQLIEKFNESPYVCKVLGVLATAEDDPQTATKVLIAMEGEGISAEHKSFATYVKDLSK